MLGRHVIIFEAKFLRFNIYKKIPLSITKEEFFLYFVFYSKIQPFVKSTFTGFKSLM